MEFTHGRRDIRFSCEEEDQEEDTKNHLLHPSSSSSSDNGGRRPPQPETGDVPSVPPALVEKEHMFDKVVTPSDVGKLNRLVIPKQHAEKYFPLNASVNEKGLLLSFEDRNGKPWRFRYSYWNSSQSYVMTKGWSHFVKEKRLDAGDTVSFGRGVGEPGRDRLFIDWKRRTGAQLDPPRLPHYHPFVSFDPSSLPSPWGPRIFLPPARPNGTQFLYFQPAPAPALPQISGVEDGKAMVLDSVPVVSSSTAAAKRVRLFGVNLDCPESCNSDDSGSVPSQMVTQLQPRSALPSLRLGLGGVESSLAASHPEEQQTPLDLDL